MLKPVTVRRLLIAALCCAMPLTVMAQRNCDPANGLVDAGCFDLPLIRNRERTLSIWELPGDVNERLVGCGCNFAYRVAGRRYQPIVIGWLEGDTPTSFMQLNGNTIELKLTGKKYQSQKPDRESVGDRVDFTLVGKQTQVTISCTATQVCTPESSPAVCEATGYNGSITVNHGKASITFPVEGACGC